VEESTAPSNTRMRSGARHMTRYALLIQPLFRLMIRVSERPELRKESKLTERRARKGPEVHRSESAQMGPIE